MGGLRASQGLIRRLRRCGVRPGQVVAVCSGDAGQLADYWAVLRQMKVGFLPLDPALPTRQRAGILRQAGVEYVVSGSRLRRLYAGPHPRMVNRRQQGKGHNDPLSLLIATSGSSGPAKIVMLGQSAVSWAAQAANRRIRLGFTDRWLVCLPLFHVGGVAILQRCQQARAQPVVLGRFQVQQVWDSLQKRRITHLSVVPTMLHRLLPFGPPPPSLRHVLVGGAALDPALALRAMALGWPLRISYGMSEYGSQCATLAHVPQHWQAGQVGVPLAGLDMGCSPDGRIWVQGRALMLGYANRQRKAGDGLRFGRFYTQDVGERLPDGQWIIRGRADQMMICGGKNIAPQAVEQALAVCPGIEQVVVLGIKDGEWGQVVGAAYTGSVHPSEVKRWAHDHLPPSWCPRHLLPLATLPLLANGKPDRQLVRQLLCSKPPLIL